MCALLAQGEADVAIGGRRFPLRRGFIDDLQRHDQATRIRELRRALLVLHSTHDAMVDIDNARAIFEAARHPKSFVTLDRADHLLTNAADADCVAEVVAARAWRDLAAPAPAPVA